MKPRWKHDCKSCIFLGVHPLGDLYVCKDTLIVRYSSDAPDYSSTLVAIVERWIHGGDSCGGLDPESTGTIWELSTSHAYLLAYVRSRALGKLKLGLQP